MIEFIKKLFRKSQAEIKVITNKDIKRLKTKYVMIKKNGKLTKFRVVTNGAGIASLIEVKK